jgi:hypothetical protein
MQPATPNDAALPDTTPNQVAIRHPPPLLTGPIVGEATRTIDGEEVIELIRAPADSPRPQDNLRDVFRGLNESLEALNASAETHCRLGEISARLAQQAERRRLEQDQIEAKLSIVEEKLSILLENTDKLLDRLAQVAKPRCPDKDDTASIINPPADETTGAPESSQL